MKAARVRRSEPEGSDGLPAAVAAALKGAMWDADKEQWRQ